MGGAARGRRLGYVLEEIRIRGLGVIADAEISLDHGLTVLTGETGAGKTMVVQALQLLFGGRADAGALSAGAARAVVEGRLVVRGHSEAAAVAEEAGAAVEDGVVLLSRTIQADGRSRAHLGGRAVPAGVLAELAGEVLSVHGQSDQTRLLRPAEQRAALDRFAGESVAKAAIGYRTEYAGLRALEAEIAQLTDRAADRAEEVHRLREDLATVAAVAPGAGEDICVSEELDRLEHAEALRAAAQVAHIALSGQAEDSGAASATGDVIGLLARARRELSGVADHDQTLAALASRADELAFLAADLGSDLSSYLDGLDADPVRLVALQQRKAALAGLTRVLAPTINEVLQWASLAGERLAELEDDDRVDALTRQHAVAFSQLSRTATHLREVRVAAAERFSAAVSAELKVLAMPHAQVEATVGFRESEAGLPVHGAHMAFGPDGVDEVELLLKAHPGAAPRPLQKGASGGELSRVMLAVEVVFAGADPVETMVFDEVDAGVGGAAAVEIGRRLCRLARTHQVLCVTHLPQVAAFADRHLVVRKSSEGTVTTSDVIAVSGEERARELSRMLAGLDSSELARGHAHELLDLAAAERAEVDR